ncbi:helix-turn-helix transcriptional regulator [Streptomyces palmae]|uniref:DNA-binding protein n=1 Tax=Streptomyces palmae TaxID=1701085 RepID=A0A4Z0HHE0_9ACTN|nr:helix-turn-helix domain-containing protein [Streptomyces palmae]TGB19588.1 DNA-binding protein [Streptomyces palmae]
MPNRVQPHISAAEADATTALPVPANATYTTRELARLLKVDPSTIRRWRTAQPPQGPPFISLSARHTIYRAADVHQWLEQRRVDPGEAA